MNNSGVIVVNKPKGCTSRDVVNRICKVVGTKKVGHTGTLDPMAEGVLIVCFGKATKIVELLTAEDKEYIAGVKLGVESDSYDTEGTIVKTMDVPLDLDLEKVVSSFYGTYMQEVPIYSAVKVNGKKLYEYARKGDTIKLPKKEVTIKEIEILERKNDIFSFRTVVTKGCYIRSLIHDMGLLLGTGAVMTSLIRTKQGNVSIDEACSLDDIEKGKYKLYSIEDVLSYPIIELDSKLAFKVKNGVKLENEWNIDDKVLFKSNGTLLGIYENDCGILKVWKNFN